MQFTKFRNMLTSNLRTFQKLCIRNWVNMSAVKNINEETSQLKSWKEIPGPTSFPIIGLLPHFLPGGSLSHSNRLDRLTYLFNTYGPIVKMDGTLSIPAHIVLFDPESVAQVHRSEVLPIRPVLEPLSYYRKHYKGRKDQSVKNTGVVTEHGELWKEFRSAVNPIFAPPKIIRLYTTLIDEVAMDMVKRLKSIRNDNNIFNNDFRLEMNLWALESVSIIALGIRLNCFDENLTEDSPVYRFIESTRDFFDVFEKLEFKPNLWKYFSTPTFKKAMKVYEVQEELARYFVRKSIEQLKTNKCNPEKEKTSLEKLLEINEEYAFIMATDLVIAGVDTTANMMMTILYLLASNPVKQEILREEVLSKEEKKPYLKACLKESMRMFPAIPFNVRTTTKEYNILGYHIPKNTMINFAHQNMSLMEKHFPKANEFIPERWLFEKEHPLYYGTAHPFATSPFGYGARSCIGRRIAELEIETFLTRIMENFRIQWFGKPAVIGKAFMNYIEKPYNFIFKDI